MKNFNKSISKIQYMFLCTLLIGLFLLFYDACIGGGYYWNSVYIKVIQIFNGIKDIQWGI